MLFSIVVACFNAGDELKKTIDSILEQTFDDYEIIIKDAGSTDGCIDHIDTNNARVKLISKPDAGIYDGMNQALEHVSGLYVIFLNCGDYFYSDTTLEDITVYLKGYRNETIFYGNQYNRKAKAYVHANPHIDGFACFRHLPCHQSCVYSTSLFSERKYSLDYPVRGDYEHFLWCFYIKKIKPQYMDITVCSYEGGGFSETKQGVIQSGREHKIITEKYMSPAEIRSYKTKLFLTLAPIRRLIAENPMTARVYQKLKSLIYRG